MLYHGPASTLTKRVEHRTFKIADIEGNRRQVLVRALRQPNVIDGVIQGKDVRIVTKEISEKPLDLAALRAGPKVRLEEVPPRFEDAFIDILGGGPGGDSLLAENMPKVVVNEKTVIEAKSLTKKFGTFTAADNITFEIRPGEKAGNQP